MHIVDKPYGPWMVRPGQGKARPWVVRSGKGKARISCALVHGYAEIRGRVGGMGGGSYDHIWV